jgi:hypothetical protein
MAPCCHFIRFLLFLDLFQFAGLLISMFPGLVVFLGCRAYTIILYRVIRQLGFLGVLEDEKRGIT